MFTHYVLWDQPWFLTSFVLLFLVLTKDQHSRNKNSQGWGGGGGGGSDLKWRGWSASILLDAAFRELTTWTPLVSSGLSQFSSRAMKRQKLVSLYSRGWSFTWATCVPRAPRSFLRPDHFSSLSNTIRFLSQIQKLEWRITSWSS